MLQLLTLSKLLVLSYTKLNIRLIYFILLQRDLSQMNFTAYLQANTYKK